MQVRGTVAGYFCLHVVIVVLSSWQFLVVFFIVVSCLLTLLSFCSPFPILIFFFISTSSVDYEVVVEDEAAMVELSAAVVSKMADSDAFTTALAASMTTNGVTSVTVADIEADTTYVPTNSGTSGVAIPEVGELSLGHKSGANLIASLLVVTAAVMIM